MAVCLFGISSPEPLHYCPSSHPGPSFSCPEYKYTEHMAAHKTHNTQPQGLSREVRPLLIPTLAQDLRTPDQLDLLPSGMEASISQPSSPG